MVRHRGQVGGRCAAVRRPRERGRLVLVHPPEAETAPPPGFSIVRRSQPDLLCLDRRKWCLIRGKFCAAAGCVAVRKAWFQRGWVGTTGLPPEASQLLYSLWFMRMVGLRQLNSVGKFLMFVLLAGRAWAGGSGLNTLVVVNQNSADSVALGNYYCEQRQVPADNVVRISWSGGRVAWDAAQFETVLLQPVWQALAQRGLSGQISHLVLSMDIPYQTVNGSTVNSTTASLFYGVKRDSEAGPLANSYFGSEGVFPDAAPVTAPTPSFLATMITGPTLAAARRVVDQGVRSDGTFPDAPVVLAKTSDPLRRIRFVEFDDACFNTQLRGNYQVIRVDEDSPLGRSGLLGYQTGLAYFSIGSDVFVPGAMADSLTSFGGQLFNGGQTTALAFLQAGAAGSYGTVAEPGANLAKFPHPQNYFYQARGFTLAECYYQSLQLPYQGLVVGEPLAAPFARSGTGTWLTPPPQAVLRGVAPLRLHFSAAEATRPLQQVDLFVDGKFFQTVTHIAPQAGNRIEARLGTQRITYTVPPGATLGSIAAGLAAAFNATSVSNRTRTLAVAYGDRVELRDAAPRRPAAPVNLRPATAAAPEDNSAAPVPFHTSAGTGPALTTFITAARPAFLDSPAHGARQYTVGGTVQVGTWLQLHHIPSSGAVVTVGYTNQQPGATSAQVLSNLLAAINATPALQGPDGVAAADLTTGFGNPTFTLVARSPGRRAAETQVAFTGSGSLVLSPARTNRLTANLSDLQPRNHLYLTAGALELPVEVAFDTTPLPDGHHELTAVAYEGSHVRTQTKITLPIRIQNTTLEAALDAPDLEATNAVSGTYHLQVTANVPDVVRVTLFSTGGALETLEGSGPQHFTISGTALGAGLHPFYALVQDRGGRQYRTATRWTRLVTP